MTLSTFKINDNYESTDESDDELSENDKIDFKDIW